MKKRKKIVRQGTRSCIRSGDEKDVNVLYRTGSTIQKRGGGTLVTHRTGDHVMHDRHDDGADFVLRTFEAINKTELNIYTENKQPLFLSGRDARALYNLLRLHYEEKNP